MAFLLFGGEFPGTDFIPRLFPSTCCCSRAPARLITAHLMLVVYHKHTQWPGPGRTEQNVVGMPYPARVRRQGRRLLLHVFGVWR